MPVAGFGEEQFLPFDRLGGANPTPGQRSEGGKRHIRTIYLRCAFRLPLRSSGSPGCPAPPSCHGPRANRAGHNQTRLTMSALINCGLGGTETNLPAGSSAALGTNFVPRDGNQFLSVPRAHFPRFAPTGTKGLQTLAKGMTGKASRETQDLQEVLSFESISIVLSILYNTATGANVKCRDAAGTDSLTAPQYRAESPIALPAQLSVGLRALPGHGKSPISPFSKRFGGLCALQPRFPSSRAARSDGNQDGGHPKA